MSSVCGVTTAIVFASGPPLDLPALRWIERLAEPIVVAADSGYDRARCHGIEVDVLIGDLDSITSDGLSHAHEMGVEVFRLPRQKNQTDLEAAISHACGLPVTELVIVASLTGRADHALGVVAAIGADWGLPVRAVIDEALGWVVRSRLDLTLPIGTTVSLIPLGGSALRVTTSGLAYRLDHETLRWDRARGVSNEVLNPKVSVEVGYGVVLLLYEGFG